MSRLLERLNRLIATEYSERKRALLKAERATYLSRIGKFSEAKSAIEELRKNYGDGHDGRVLVRIMLAEGVLQIYESLRPEAVDRFKRAEFIANLIGDEDAIAVALAWKAHVEFETSNFDSMFESIAAALEVAKPDNHQALTRTSMVLCDVFTFCGNSEQSQRWFLKSRDHALIDGDQASIDALLYNRAAFRLARIRAQYCFGILDKEELQTCKMEISSARNYQTIIDIHAFLDFITLCEARFHVISGNFDLAIEKYKSLAGSGPFASYNYSNEYTSLELCYCLLKLGRTQEAIDSYNIGSALPIDGLDIDEQLFARWILWQITLDNAKIGNSEHAEHSFSQAKDKYEELIHRLGDKSKLFLLPAT